MSLFKFFSCCLPSRQSKRSPVLDSPIAVPPSSPDVSLLDMPDLVMREILKYLDYLTIQKLRKTSYSLRQFIDYVKVDSGLKDFKIEITGDTIFGTATVLMKGYISSKTTKAGYIENEDGCEVKTFWRKITQRKLSGNFVDVYAEDFLSPMLKNQKSLLTTLKLGPGVEGIRKWAKMKKRIFEKLFDCLMKVLKSRDRPLQVEDLEVYVQEQDQLMQLLYYVDLKSLKRLEVRRWLESYPKNDDEWLLDLSLLKCAENLIELRVVNFTIFSSFRCIAHVPKLEVKVYKISCDDVLKYQETLQKANFLSRSIISYQQFPDKLRFKNLYARRLYFPTSGTIRLSHYPKSKRMYWGPIH